MIVPLDFKLSVGPHLVATMQLTERDGDFFAINNAALQYYEDYQRAEDFYERTRQSIINSLGIPASLYTAPSYGSRWYSGFPLT